MFLTEKELRNKFWKNHNYSGHASRYEFESPVPEGNGDLITMQIFQENFKIDAN